MNGVRRNRQVAAEGLMRKKRAEEKESQRSAFNQDEVAFRSPEIADAAESRYWWAVAMFLDFLTES